MKRPLYLRRLAKIEFDQSHDFYEGREKGLGKRFSKAVQSAFDSIAANPEIHQFVVLDIRKAVVRGFPFCIYYYEEGNRVVLISVFHTSRNPAVWMGRR